MGIDPYNLCLGIETSCDETSVSVVEGGRRILSNIIASQVDLHALYGGVVPELASRKHLEAFSPVVREALSQAGLKLADIDAVAVTSGPGLAGALLVGLCGGKALAYALGIDMIGVNHLEGHLYANFLDTKTGPEPEFPLMCLVVSGGHTDMVLMEGHGKLRLMGHTRDDAAGEAFDKVARLLSLGYPGGPLVDALAKTGDPRSVKLPKAYLEEGSLDTSFSGLKTAVAHVVESGGYAAKDIAASFQYTVAQVLADKAMLAVKKTGARMLMLAGGVSANSEVRRTLTERCKRHGIPVRIPPSVLCTDNAAMIACAGYHGLIRGIKSGWDLNAQANLRLGSAEEKL